MTLSAPLDISSSALSLTPYPINIAVNGTSLSSANSLAFPRSSKVTGEKRPFLISETTQTPFQEERSSSSPPSFSIERAPSGQVSTQVPQRVQEPSSTLALSSTTLMAPKLQTSSHSPQPIHFSMSIFNIK